jgi:sulfoxide reductase heme-binding subunit YedZ
VRKLLLLIALTVAPLGLAPMALAAASPAPTQAGSGDIIVQTVSGPTVASQLAKRTQSSWSWYLTRASGMIASFALVLLLLSGIGQVTGYTFRFLEPLTAWASHRALGLTFTVAVLVHMFTLLFDHFVPFSLGTLFVPWLSSYKPVTLYGHHLGSLYVALGVLAFYAVVVVVLTSLFWIDKKPYIWKISHLLSYFILAAVFVHTLNLGTDVQSGFFRWLWIGAGIVLLGATINRLWRAKTI